MTGEVGAIEPCSTLADFDDTIEPLTPPPDYRDAARRCLDRINSVLVYILESPSRELGCWAAAFALRVECANRRTVAEIVGLLGVPASTLESEIERARMLLA